MFRPENAWPDTPASGGTLFFAQAMRSFLETEEFEGFRAYTLDTLGRLNEAISIADNISKGTLAQPVLEPAARELAWSLRVDRASQALAKDECGLIIHQCENDHQNYRGLLSNMQLLKRRLYPRYRTQLTYEVVSRINDPKNRSDLLAATGFLVSHLINDGHDREFITNSVTERFFTAQIKRVGAAVVQAFINGIGDERNQYKVFHGIDETIAKILEGREGWEITRRDDLDQLMLNQVNSWHDGEKYQHFATKTERSPDPYKAAIAANDELDRLKAFMIIPTKRFSVGWSRDCYVRRPRGKLGHALIRYDRPLQKITALSGGGNGKLIKRSHFSRKWSARSTRRPYRGYPELSQRPTPLQKPPRKRLE